MRPDQYGTSAGGRLDQILPTQRQEAATDEGKVGQAVVSSHFAHAVTKPDRRITIRQALAAANRRQALLPQQRSHFVKTLRMARHQHQQGIGKGGTTPCLENQGFLSLAGTRCQPYRARADRLTPLLPQRDLVCRRADVEFEVAGHLDLFDTQGKQPVCISPGLGCHPGECRKGRPDKAPETAVTSRRAR
ncbi:hypothetical protein SDC9_188454 [bioreactor metagenome]|uniref:Uncharacterized protein n=1 Tax=bioreactor metagenome TaxID=1076179 RepID=A0A645HXM0_9ZZZZ